jgi:sugar/nucleoside kinase (ribokinase family)
MQTTIYDVCGIGNAIVDILAETSEKFITEQHLAKGRMTMIDEARAEYLYTCMEGKARECSGGSVANSLAGIASLGGMPAFIGKTKQDALGESFRYDMHAIGVHFDTPAAAQGKSTACCYIFVTPDAQRTMNTYIGACAELTEADINDALIAHSKLIYIEGCMWDTPGAKAAIRKAMRIAKAKNRKVAFTLSDVFCVRRHHAEFMELAGSVDILFANEQELKALMQTDSLERAIQQARGRCPILAVTCSEKGSLILTKDEVFLQEADKNLNVIDTTGAGDLYAAGFLFGYTQGWDLKRCAALGTKCASEIIQHFGARPQQSLKGLI